jgi:hypothetical protein
MSKKYEIQLRNWIREIVQEELARLDTRPDESSLQEKERQPRSFSPTSAKCANEINRTLQVRLGTPIPDPTRKPSIFKKRARPPRSLPDWPDLYRPDFEGLDPAPYLIKRERYQLYTQKLP